MNTTERFLKYVSFPTMSDETSETCPSSAKQLALSSYLAEELTELGLTDVELDEKWRLKEKSFSFAFSVMPVVTGDIDCFEELERI